MAITTSLRDSVIATGKLVTGEDKWLPYRASAPTTGQTVHVGYSFLTMLPATDYINISPLTTEDQQFAAFVATFCPRYRFLSPAQQKDVRDGFSDYLKNFRSHFSLDPIDQSPVFDPFVASQQQALERVFRAIEATANIKFWNVSPGAPALPGGIALTGPVMRFANVSAPAAGGFNWPFIVPALWTGAAADRLINDVFIDLEARFSTGTQVEEGSAQFSVLMHETLHALGLRHPHDYAPYAIDADGSELDSAYYTQMSYDDSLLPEGLSYGETPLVLDVAALQHLFGAAPVSGGSDSRHYVEKRDAAGTVTENRKDRRIALWDSGGANDWLDASAQTTSADINLNEGQLSSINGLLNVAIAYGGPGNEDPIENAEGGSAADVLRGSKESNQLKGNGGNDVLFGGAGSDTLTGGAGNDYLEGGADLDTYVFFTLPSAAPADKDAAGIDTIRDSDGSIVVDGQPLTGSANAVIAQGYWRDGNGFLYRFEPDGSGQGELRIYRDGHAILVQQFRNGGFGINLTGTFTPVVLPPSSNAGESKTTTYYDQSHTVIDARGAGAVEVSALGAFGEVYADGGSRLLGNDSDNYLHNGPGDEELFGLGGRDVLVATAGNDLLDGGLGEDALTGGDGDDVLIGGGDGSRDVLAGGTGADVLIGGDGADIIFGGGSVEAIRHTWSVTESGGTVFLNEFGGASNLAGDGSDYIEGGAGADFLWGGEAADYLFGGADDDQLVGEAHDDALYGEAGADRLFGDDSALPGDTHGADRLEGGRGERLPRG